MQLIKRDIPIDKKHGFALQRQTKMTNFTQPK